VSGEKHPLFQKIVFHYEEKDSTIFEKVGQNARPSAKANIPEDVKVIKAATIPSNLIKLDSTSVLETLCNKRNSCLYTAFLFFAVTFPKNIKWVYIFQEFV
jgi:hypothetical protein